MYDNLRHMYYYLKDITEQRQFLCCKLAEWCNSYTKDLLFQKKFEKNLADWKKKKQTTQTRPPDGSFAEMFALFRIAW